MWSLLTFSICPSRPVPTLLHGPRGRLMTHVGCICGLPCPLVTGWLWPVEGIGGRSEAKKIGRSGIYPICLVSSALAPPLTLYLSKFLGLNSRIRVCPPCQVSLGMAAFQYKSPASYRTALSLIVLSPGSGNFSQRARTKAGGKPKAEGSKWVRSNKVKE